MKRKIAAVFLSLLILFGSTAINVQRAQAFLPLVLAPVLGGAVSTEVMAHVIGGLLVAVGGGAVAAEYGDEIKQKSIELAEGSTAYLKDGFKNATDISSDWAKGTVSFTGEMLNELKNLSGDIGAWVSGLLKSAEGTELSVGGTLRKYNSNGVNIGTSDGSGFHVTWNGVEYSSIRTQGTDVLLGHDDRTNEWITLVSGVDISGSFSKDYSAMYQSSNLQTAITFFEKYYHGFVGIIPYSTSLTSPDSEIISTTYDEYVDGLKEVDVPLDQWLSSVKSIDGQPLTVDTATNELMLDGVPYTGEITSDYDVPIIDTGATYGAPSVPIENVLSIPDVGTGEGTGSGDNVGNGEINWPKLKMIGDIFTTKFPFSLPWDIGRALGAVFGQFDEHNIPKYDWSFNALGKSYMIHITIPDMIAEWFPITRTLLLIGFDISLVFAVRKLLGGAQ